jgi:hypothetical protein
VNKDFYQTFEDVCARTCGVILPINEIRLDENGTDIYVLHSVEDGAPPIATIDGCMVREVGFFISTTDLKSTEIN